MPAILSSLSRLEPGQSLRLVAPFEPVPLYDFLASRGFSHSSHQEKSGDWVVLFTPLPANS